ncbi:MAG: acetylxylan esterase [Chlorobia bacterium]|nr:acetylxylan esterase [Fimbriimonadaceae bacterium]
MFRRGSLTAAAAIAPFVLFACSGAWSKASVQAGAKPVVTPLKSSGIYDVSEKVGWTISGSGIYNYVAKKNNHTQLSSGVVNLSKSSAGDTAKIEFEVKEPCMVYLEVTETGGKPMAFGAAVAPTKLRPVVPAPADFDEFWRGKIAELRKVPENPVVTPGESGKPDLSYSLVQMDHLNGTKVYGQLAKPSKTGKYPALLVLQWASPPYPLDKSWATNPAAGGWLVLNIQPHNVPVSGPPEVFSGVLPEIKNYGSIGQRDRDRNYFVEMYLRGYRAVDFLARHPEWDRQTIVVTGGSMGGQQSFAVAGLHPRVTHMMANEPAGCDLNGPNHGRQNSYPFYPTGDAQAMATAGYIDAVNFAPRIRATCLVSMGFIDTATAPAGIWTAFNQIKGPKVAAPMIDAAHNNIATWEQQQPYYSRQSEWMKALAAGDKVDLK